MIININLSAVSFELFKTIQIVIIRRKETLKMTDQAIFYVTEIWSAAAYLPNKYNQYYKYLRKVGKISENHNSIIQMSRSICGGK